jgi:hypothetical protein
MQSATNLFADLIAEAQPFDTESPAKTARPLYRAECCNAAIAFSMVIFILGLAPIVLVAVAVPVLEATQRLSHSHSSFMGT